MAARTARDGAQAKAAPLPSPATRAGVARAVVPKLAPVALAASAPRIAPATLGATASRIAAPMKPAALRADFGAQRAGGRGRFGDLHKILTDLQRILNAIVELNLPGGGAADFRRPSTDAGQPLRRLFPSNYDDVRSAPPGSDRPGAREISNVVSADTGDKANKAGASDLFWLWGQFMDHDIDLSLTGDETISIPVPKGDPSFDPDGEGDVTLQLHRSESKKNLLGAEQQINAITALIDASNVYGSTQEVTDSLRSFEGGRLKTSEGDYLPKDTAGFYLAGDIRVNENIALTSMHTLFMREHNRIADFLTEHYPRWSDDRVFEEARRWVTAQLQAITVNEFLPILLGEDGLGRYRGPRRVDAQVSNSFAAAAYRFGHSMVSDTVERVGADGSSDPVALKDAFFNPRGFAETGPDAILRGMAGNVAQAMDPEIVDSLRNFVLEGPTSGNLDLAALNIARGRDHGLPTLNDARRALGMHAITSFDDPAFRDGTGARLVQVYDSPEDIDLWIGLLAEAPEGDGLVGPTQHAILADQFTRLRDGDRNWYQNTFTRWQTVALNNNTLADVIRRNSDVDDIQDRAMIVPGVA